MWRGRTIHWLVVAATLSLSCSGAPTEWPLAHDLVAGFPLADAWSETRVVDFGDAWADRLLGGGWHGRQWDRGRREVFAVGRGDESEVDFLVLRPRRLTLRLQAGPSRGAADPIVAVEVLVNGNRFDDLEIRERVRRGRVPIPEGFLPAGENLLTFRYLSAESQGTEGESGEDRGSQVAW